MSIFNPRGEDTSDIAGSIWQGIKSVEEDYSVNILSGDLDSSGTGCCSGTTLSSSDICSSITDNCISVDAGNVLTTGTDGKLYAQPSGIAGGTLYSSNGNIPTSTTRTVTLESGADLVFSGDFGTVFQIDGDTGKVTVPGLFDPTGTQFTQVAANPGNVNTIWVNSSTGRLMRGDRDLEFVVSGDSGNLISSGSDGNVFISDTDIINSVDGASLISTDVGNILTSGVDNLLYVPVGSGSNTNYAQNSLVSTGSQSHTWGINTLKEIFAIGSVVGTHTKTGVNDIVNYSGAVGITNVKTRDLDFIVDSSIPIIPTSSQFVVDGSKVEVTSTSAGSNTVSTFQDSLYSTTLTQGSISYVIGTDSVNGAFLNVNDGGDICGHFVKTDGIITTFSSGDDWSIGQTGSELPGTSGQVLSSNGAGNPPQWKTPESIKLPVLIEPSGSINITSEKINSFIVVDATGAGENIQLPSLSDINVDDCVEVYNRSDSDFTILPSGSDDVFGSTQVPAGIGFTAKAISSSSWVLIGTGERINATYKQTFIVDDWVNGGATSTLTILNSVHQLNSSPLLAQVYSSGGDLVTISTNVDPTGNVVFTETSGDEFQGSLILHG